jgi:hypothetical protein
VEALLEALHGDEDEDAPAALQPFRGGTFFRSPAALICSPGMLRAYCGEETDATPLPPPAARSFGAELDANVLWSDHFVA